MDLTADFARSSCSQDKEAVEVQNEILSFYGNGNGNYELQQLIQHFNDSSSEERYENFANDDRVQASDDLDYFD